jgi:hypothetical protein
MMVILSIATHVPVRHRQRSSIPADILSAFSDYSYIVARSRMPARRTLGGRALPHSITSIFF